MTSSPTEAEASPSSGSSEQMEPADYCALLCREPDRLRLVNAHEEVVEVVRGCLGRAELPFTFYYKSRATCAFKLAGSPFAAAGCSQEVMVQVRRALAWASSGVRSECCGLASEGFCSLLRDLERLWLRRRAAS